MFPRAYTSLRGDRVRQFPEGARAAASGDGVRAGNLRSRWQDNPGWGDPSHRPAGRTCGQERSSHHPVEESGGQAGEEPSPTPLPGRLPGRIQGGASRHGRSTCLRTDVLDPCRERLPRMGPGATESETPMQREGRCRRCRRGQGYGIDADPIVVRKRRARARPNPCHLCSSVRNPPKPWPQASRRILDHEGGVSPDLLQGTPVHAAQTSEIRTFARLYARIRPRRARKVIGCFVSSSDGSPHPRIETPETRVRIRPRGIDHLPCAPRGEDLDRSHSRAAPPGQLHNLFEGKRTDLCRAAPEPRRAYLPSPRHHRMVGIQPRRLT